MLCQPLPTKQRGPVGLSKVLKMLKREKVTCCTKKGSLKFTCGEKMCLNCEEFVDPNTHQCYMKPIVNREEDSGEAHEA